MICSRQRGPTFVEFVILNSPFNCKAYAYRSQSLNAQYDIQVSNR